MSKEKGKKVAKEQMVTISEDNLRKEDMQTADSTTTIYPHMGDAGPQDGGVVKNTSAGNNKDKGNSEEDSEDQGLKIDDIISAEGDHLIFGDFSSNEVRSLCSVQLKENESAVINEYGSNMIKSKMDPLVVIEAKNALVVGGYSELTHSELMIDTMHTATTVLEITPEEGQHILENTEKYLEDT